MPYITVLTFYSPTHALMCEDMWAVCVLEFECQVTFIYGIPCNVVHERRIFVKHTDALHAHPRLFTEHEKREAV